jgi:hypothetical protein
VLASALLIVATLAPTGLSASAAPDDTLLTVPASGSVTDDTLNEFIDLDRDLSECAGTSIEKPGCGRQPTHSGDRGSAMQWTVFALMGLGIGFIGWRIVRGARNTA